MDIDAAKAYDKYADELIRFATVLVGASVAEDVMAAALTRVLTRPGWAELEDLRAYLYRCITNEAMSQHRSTQARLRRELNAARMAGEDRSGFVRVEVIDAMLHLSIRQRAVVYLTYWHDLDASMIATQLEVSVRTVERELTRARRSLEVLLR